MTMRSKQWYTKASRLPNSLPKVSIGPPRCACFDNKIIRQRTGGNPAGGQREGFPRAESLATPRIGEGSEADHANNQTELLERTTQLQCVLRRCFTSRMPI